MKIKSSSNFVASSSLALALALGLAAPLQAQSGMPMKDQPMMESKTAVPGPATKPAKGMMMDGKMMEAHQGMAGSEQAMMQHHQAMMAEMKAQDAEIAKQVAAMNSAPTDQKLNLLAAIVTRMVEQRTAMNSRMGMMQGEMMKCSMSDMSMDANAPAPQPMMKGMEGKMEEPKK